MNTSAGPRARRAVSIGSALLLVLATTGLVLAQEPLAGPSSPPAAPGAETPEASAAPPARAANPSGQVVVDEDRAAPVMLGPWQRAVLDDAPEGLVVRGVAASDPGLVAVGNLEFGGPAQPAAWFSPDGLEWQRATFDADTPGGLMEAAVATPDGWVAVGRDVPEHARAWFSSDGLQWQDITDIESAAGHIMLGVAATPTGLTAVGCEAQLHCRAGVAWHSQDGRSWQLAGEVPIQRPMAVGSVETATFAVGQSDGAEMTRSHGVTSRSMDGSSWDAASRDFKGPGGFFDVAQLDDELLAVGVKLGKRGPKDQTRLYRTTDGVDWERIKDRALAGWDGFAVAASDELVVVAGTRPGENILPITVSSHDRLSWSGGTFADGLNGDDYQVFDVAITSDGDRAVLVGADTRVPAIWYADTVPVPEPVVATGEPVAFQTATVPETALGISVQDIISGGPGYIAVGGGSNTGLDMKALVWTSENGMTWQPATLKGKAANGLVMGVAPLPGGGYVAVGRDFAPANRPDDAPANALVWHSADGTSWTRIKPHKTFKGSILYDVAPTAEGVIAVGCRSDFHCREGRVWTSRDGRAWKLRKKLPMAPFTVSVNRGVTAAGGIDDAVTLGAGRAVIASDAAARWGVAGPLGPRKSQMTASSPYGDGITMVGWQYPSDGDRYTSALYLSQDGDSWDRVSDATFDGLTATGIDTSGELALVTGTRFDPEVGSTPLAYWSRDLETFQEVDFPDDLELDGLDLFAAAISDDGDMAFAVGQQGYRPAIWYSPIE